MERAGLSPEDIAGLVEIGRRAEAGDTTKFSRGLRPDDILLVVAGGEAGGHSAFIPSWSRERASIFQTKAIVQSCEVCDI